LAVDDFIVH